MVIGRVASAAGAAAAEASTSIDELSAGALGAGIGVAATVTGWLEAVAEGSAAGTTGVVVEAGTEAGAGAGGGRSGMGKVEVEVEGATPLGSSLLKFGVGLDVLKMDGLATGEARPLPFEVPFGDLWDRRSRRSPVPSSSESDSSVSGAIRWS